MSLEYVGPLKSTMAQLAAMWATQCVALGMSLQMHTAFERLGADGAPVLRSHRHGGIRRAFNSEVRRTQPGAADHRLNSV